MDARLIRYLESIGVGADALEGWTVEIAMKDGVDAGFVISKGSEIHIYPFYAGAMSRKNIIDHLSPILAEFGFATTRTPITEQDDRLRTVLGFTETWRCNKYKYWAITELPFQRKDKSCQ